MGSGKFSGYFRSLCVFCILAFLSFGNPQLSLADQRHDAEACSEELLRPDAADVARAVADVQDALNALTNGPAGSSPTVDPVAEATALAAQDYVAGALARCDAGECADDLDEAIHLSRRVKWQDMKLVPQRLLFVAAWVTTVFGTSMGAYKLGAHSGNGTAFALAASTISTAIYFPLGNAFLFRVAAFFQRLGHVIWGGQDIYSRDKKNYDERKAFSRGQLINLRLSMIPSLDKAVAQLRAGRPEKAAKKIAEGVRTSYRLFRGVEPDEPTLLDLIETHFIDEIEGELPPEFFRALETELFSCKWKDYPARSRHCRQLAKDVMRHWFNAPTSNNR